MPTPLIIWIPTDYTTARECGLVEYEDEADYVSAVARTEQGCQACGMEFIRLRASTEDVIGALTTLDVDTNIMGLAAALAFLVNGRDPEDHWKTPPLS